MSAADERPSHGIRGLSRITENSLGIELKRAVREQYGRLARSVVLIEDKAWAYN